MERIHITVPPETRERWEQAVEDHPSHNSMPEFVRMSVETHLADDDSEGVNVDIAHELDPLESRIADLEDQVKAARQEQMGNKEFEELLDFKLSELRIDLEEGMDTVRQIYAMLANDD